MGKDLNNLLWEIIKYVKDILVYKATGKLEIYSKDELEDIKQLVEIVSKERLLYIVTDLSKLENDMKWSAQKSILFQVEIIKLCSKDIIESPVKSVNKSSSEHDRTVDNGKNYRNVFTKASSRRNWNGWNSAGTK